MPRKCPKGAICFETYTLLFLVILSTIAIYYFTQKIILKLPTRSISGYIHNHNNLPPHGHLSGQHHGLASMFNLSSDTISVQRQPIQSGYNMLRPVADPRISFSENPKDTLMNPYAPPVQYNEPHAYRQVGFLKSSNYGDKMFPIFAKPYHIRRDKWYYYTIFDSIKLPIYYRGRKCSSEHGCDELYDGEIVQLQGMKGDFTVSMYDNNTLVYEPHI